MRILHTSDWHLGRSYSSISLKEEQENTLDEIASICERKNIDVVLIAGDIFNGINTPGYADEMFINSIMKISDGGRRAIIAIAGNNDEGTRFAASRRFAEKQNIFLIKNMNYDYQSEPNNELPIKLINIGVGFVKLQKDNEILTVAAIPHSAYVNINEALMPDEKFAEKVKECFSMGTAMFEPKGQGINIGLTHFSFENNVLKDNWHYSLNSSIFSDEFDYVALGHQHCKVEIANNIFYSGSTIQTYIGEDSSKYVIILNTENNQIESKEFVKLKTPKRLIEVKPKNYDDAISILDKLDNCYVEITFDKDAISSDDIRKIKSKYNFITKFNLKPVMRKKKPKEEILKKIEPADVFSEFYEKQVGKQVNKELLDTFMEVFMGGEQDEAD